MYHYWSFKGIDALVSAGLGGGSLIYANVFLRKDERWFVDEDVNDGGYESWPVTRADLDPHYDRVEKMIGLQRYPFEHEPYASTPKTIAFKHAAERNGLEWFLPPLAVTFANEGEPAACRARRSRRRSANLHDRDRVTCQLCGECDVGCNFGAKNTLDYNYLTHAKHHGAEIRTLCDVRTIEPRDGGGYTVGYAALDAEHGAADEQRPPGAADAAHVRPPRAQRRHARDHEPAAAQPQRLPAPQPQARHALLRQRRPADAGRSTAAEVTDGKRVPRIIDPGYGPVITSTARMPDALDGGEGRGFYLQDAGYPQHLAWILHVLAAPQDAVELALARLRTWSRTGCKRLAGHRRHRPHRRPARVGRAVGRRPAAARHGPRHPRRAHVPAQRPARPRLEARRSPTPTSSGCAPRRAASRTRSAAGSPTTRSGSSSA